MYNLSIYPVLINILKTNETVRNTIHESIKSFNASQAKNMGLFIYTDNDGEFKKIQAETIKNQSDDYEISYLENENCYSFCILNGKNQNTMSDKPKDLLDSYIDKLEKLYSTITYFNKLVEIMDKADQLHFGKGDELSTKQAIANWYDNQPFYMSLLSEYYADLKESYTLADNSNDEDFWMDKMFSIKNLDLADGYCSTLWDQIYDVIKFYKDDTEDVPECKYEKLLNNLADTEKAFLTI